MKLPFFNRPKPSKAPQDGAFSFSNVDIISQISIHDRRRIRRKYEKRFSHAPHIRAELAELKDWHAKLSRVDPAGWEDWFGGPISPLDENYERAKVYFTDLLMYGELEIDKR